VEVCGWEAARSWRAWAGGGLWLVHKHAGCAAHACGTEGCVGSVSSGAHGVAPSSVRPWLAG
jgi:hypothetical protein